MNLRAWLRAPFVPPPRYRVFCALGGSGSTALLQALDRSQRFVRYGERADVAFLPPDTVPPYFEAGRQILDERGLDAPPIPSAVKIFRDRSGYRMRPDRSIRENLLAYLEFVERRRHVTLLATCPHVSFFSQEGIRDVVFLIRHPLHSFGSWTKEERHKKNIDRLGGAQREESVRFWADVWNRMVREFLVLRDEGLSPVLLRYECAREDARGVDPELDAYVRAWDGGKRNTGVLEPDLEELLREEVAEGYADLYDGWKL